ncbi:MAG TPA: rRNA pseudouridine synthase [Thermodesulfobacteriaceae bacterium]|nr:rRNA pseudouridine synthase [Thermodesulfobacteriaceae bacterium]
MIRLDQFLSRAGWGSRKEVKRLIRSGVVSVNGRMVREAAFKVSPGDRVEVSGKPVSFQEHRYFLIYKPRGYVTSTKDRLPTVMELLVGVSRTEKLFPVGRLDRDAEGALLVTDNGQLAHRLTHPKWKVPKVYLVEVEGEFSEELLPQFEEGIELSEGKTRPARARIVSRKENATFLEVILKEGRYHQIKRMFRALGFRVLNLKRVRFGPLTLEGLLPGEFRALNEDEISALRQAVGL